MCASSDLRDTSSTRCLGVKGSGATHSWTLYVQISLMTVLFIRILLSEDSLEIFDCNEGISFCLNEA